MRNELSRPSDVPAFMASATPLRALILVYLAERPGQWCSGDQLAREALGLAHRGRTIAGIFGAFGRWLYEHQEWRWPVLARKQAGLCEYMIPTHIADEVLRFA